MNYGGPPQMSSMRPQFSESSVAQEPIAGRERDEPKGRSHWDSGNNDRMFVRRQPDDRWQRSSYEDKRQSSPIRDQRNENFGKNQTVSEDSGGQQTRWGQSDTGTRNDRNDRNFLWEKANKSVLRESHRETTNVAPPQDDRNRDSGRAGPSYTTTRDNRSKNETWELSEKGNDRQPYFMLPVQSPPRPAKDPNRYGSEKYEDRKPVQGSWAIGYDQTIPIEYPDPLNSNLYSRSGKTSAMLGSHVKDAVQEHSGKHGQGRWDNSNRNSGKSQEFSQQRQSFNERKRPERVSRPSPRRAEYESKQSKFGDRRQDRASNKRPNFKSAQEPPSKRFSGQSFAKPNTFRKASPSQPSPSTMKKLLQKDQTWRQQAASAICKQMLSNETINNIGTKIPTLKQIKASIKSRIDVMMGEKLAVPFEDLIKMYRCKFNEKTDEAFVDAVLDSMKNTEGNEANTGKLVSDNSYFMI